MIACFTPYVDIELAKAAMIPLVATIAASQGWYQYVAKEDDSNRMAAETEVTKTVINANAGVQLDDDGNFKGN